MSNTFSLFRKAVRPLMGLGLGSNPIIGYVYRYLARKLVPDIEHIIDLDGYKLKVHTEKYKGIDGLAQQLIFEHSYEPFTTYIFKQLVKPGMVVIDVGANIGYFTLLSAKLVTDTGYVYAFEPEPRNYDALIHNMSINHFQNIMAMRDAVCDKCGWADLHIDSTEPGAHSIYSVRDSFHNDVRVNTVSIDSFAKIMNTKVDFIKIDVEGAEKDVLRGMHEVSRANKNLIMILEIWPYGLRRAGTELELLWYEMLRLGFNDIYLLDEKLHEAIRVNFADIKQRRELWKGKEGASVNLLCKKS
jgi:FkbM family methyltransferase